MQRGGLRASFDGVVKDLPLGVFTTAAPVLTYNPTTQVIEGAASGGGGGVTRTGSSADNHLARWDGTGAAIQDGTGVVLDDAGNITGLGTITSGNVNGVAVAAHAARHNPAGADTMFAGTWAAGDLAEWNGTVWIPKERAPLVVASAFTGAGAALTDITGLTIAVSRAGTYAYEFYLHNTLSAQPRSIAFAVNASANFTSVAGIGQVFTTATAFTYVTQTANNAMVPATVSKTITTASITLIRGRITVSGACTLSCRAQTSAVTMTVLAGSGGYFMEL